MGFFLVCASPGFFAPDGAHLFLGQGVETSARHHDGLVGPGHFQHRAWVRILKWELGWGVVVASAAPAVFLWALLFGGIGGLSSGRCPGHTHSAVVGQRVAMWDNKHQSGARAHKPRSRSLPATTPALLGSPVLMSACFLLLLLLFFFPPHPLCTLHRALVWGKGAGSCPRRWVRRGALYLRRIGRPSVTRCFFSRWRCT